MRTAGGTRWFREALHVGAWISAAVCGSGCAAKEEAPAMQSQPPASVIDSVGVPMDSMSMPAAPAPALDTTATVAVPSPAPRTPDRPPRTSAMPSLPMPRTASQMPSDSMPIRRAGSAAPLPQIGSEPAYNRTTTKDSAAIPGGPKVPREKPKP